MPRGQKKHWKTLRKLPKTPPDRAVRAEPGIWYTPAGTFHAFDYRDGKSFFLGAYATLDEAKIARATTKGRKRSSIVITLDTFKSTFFETTYSSRKPSTIRAAESRYAAHIEPELGSVQLKDLTYTRLIEFQTVLQAKGRSAQTVRETLRLLQIILDDAVLREIIDDNPSRKLKLPAKPEPELIIPPYDRVCEVLDQVEDVTARTALWLLLLSGLRVNEALILRWRDVDLGKKTIRVRHSLDQTTGQELEPKTKKAKRIVHMVPPLANLLRQYSEWQREHVEDVEFLFPDRSRTKPPYVMRDDELLRNHLRPPAKRLGLPQLTVHMLRHLFASKLLEEGVPLLYVSRQLGHAKPSFTYDQYVALTEMTEVVAVRADAAVEDVAARLYPFA